MMEISETSEAVIPTCLGRVGSEPKRRNQCTAARKCGWQAARSGSAPLAPMVQPTHLWNGDDPSGVWRLNRSGLRAVLLERQMGAAAMVVFREAFEVSVQTALAEYDHVIQVLPPERADQSTVLHRHAAKASAAPKAPV